MDKKATDQPTDGLTNVGTDFNVQVCLHLSPNDNILSLSKLKVFADDKSDLRFEICFVKSRKHCRKKRKCWLPAFSPFPTMFSKVFSLRVVKSKDCVVMVLLIFWGTEIL